MTTWMLFFIIVSVIVLSLPFLQGPARAMSDTGPDEDVPHGHESEPD
ncbi:hypothetical protein BMS3Abin14_00811 [bacterium BMS3Abin14]|nr:hypothetical protein BMS3Abin14_00811 [bacterium BMS3Abin14]